MIGATPSLLRLPKSGEDPAIPFDKSEIEGSLCQRFEMIAHQCADRIAIKTGAGLLTYGELNRKSNAIAHAILSHGREPHQPVALLFEQGADAIAAIWGVLKSGNIYVPLDPSYPVARNSRILEDAGGTLLLTNTANAVAAREYSRAGQAVLEIESVGAYPTTNPAITIPSDAPAYIIYTSGSSGEPKGVLQTHRNVLFDIRRQSQDLAISVADRYGLLFAACSSASVCHIFGAHLSGAAVLPFDFRMEGFSRLARWLEHEEISILDINVATFRELCRILPEGEGFPKLRMLAPGSEPVYKRDVDLYKRHFASSCIMQNALGTTETRTVTQYFITKDTEIDESVAPVGYPIPGKDVLLLDENRREVAPGSIGEIAVRSRHLSPGYWRKPDLTAAAFLPDEDGAEERIYLTGDLGRFRPDGLLVHLGRKDFQVKIRGYRVEVAEVETALTRLDGVLEAVVTTHGADEGKILVAYLVMKPGQAPSIRDLRIQLAKTLPEHEIPARFEFLRALPLTLNGKLDRRGLPPPSPIRTVSPEEFVSPSGELETALAALVEEVLGIAPVSVEDNFFELGGHSLLAARLSGRIEDVLGRQVPISDILLSPTVRALSAAMEAAAKEWRRRSPSPIQRSGGQPPLFCMYGSYGAAVEFLKLSHHLGDDQPLYVLECRGIDGRETPNVSIEAMAQQYLAEIKTVQPEGPYYLCGFSMGGLVAYEMAHRIHQSGERAAFVGMIDTYYPKAERSTIPAKRVRAKETLRHIFRRVRCQTYLAIAPLASRSIRMKYMEGVNEVLARSYKPKPFSGSLCYFLASRIEQPGQKRIHVDKWAQVAHVEIFEFDGPHHLLGEPYVSKVAVAMKACLDKALADAGDSSQGAEQTVTYEESALSPHFS
ncbi:MAG: amino acid adenylation domain-containing protein [Capsulimonas sp.]|uniref:amino acid adenylation domain-containing protein n=1 Tax=Capsulimonas sp. TaxID=2494211 RepID=UPI0032659549